MNGYQSDTNLSLKDVDLEGNIPVENTLGGFAVSSGTANNYLIELSTPLTQYKAGLSLQVKFHIANTTSLVRLNVDGLGFVPLKKVVDTELVDLAASDLGVAPIYDLRYDGASFQVVTGISSQGSTTANPIAGSLTLKGYLDGSKYPSFPQADRGDCYTILGNGEIGNSDFGPGLKVYEGDVVYALSGNPGGDYEDLFNDWALLSGGTVNRP